MVVGGLVEDSKDARVEEGLRMEELGRGEAIVDILMFKDIHGDLVQLQ